MATDRQLLSRRPVDTGREDSSRRIFGRRMTDMDLKYQSAIDEDVVEDDMAQMSEEESDGNIKSTNGNVNTMNDDGRAHIHGATDSVVLRSLGVPARAGDENVRESTLIDTRVQEEEEEVDRR